MALQKTVETPFGTAATYWKVSVVDVNWFNSSMNTQIHGFLDKAARDAGASPFSSINFAYSGESFDFAHTDNLVEKIYAKIKATEDWTDAVDV